MKDAIHLLVRGRVQGVGFRWFVREAARRLELSGWVMNREDGDVELIASGLPVALGELRAIVAKGPPAASVRELIELPSEHPGELPYPFDVVR